MFYEKLNENRLDILLKFIDIMIEILNHIIIIL